MTRENAAVRVPFPVSSRPLRVFPFELGVSWAVRPWPSRHDPGHRGPRAGTLGLTVCGTGHGTVRMPLMRRAYKPSAGEVGIMQKYFAGAVSAVAVIAAVTACSTTTTVVHAPAPKPTVTKTVTPKPAVTKTATQPPSPAASTPAPAPAASTPSPAPATSTPAAATPPGYLGDIFGGGTGNPCNFASGYQIGDCNPTGETEQQYIDNPGGPAPGTSTNAQAATT
jgi:hypothetical protein